MVADYAHLAGHPLPEGRIRIGPHTAWLWSYCVAGRPDTETPHPSMGWYLAEHGCGIGITELLQKFDSDPSDGPVLGEVELEFVAPMRTGGEYRVAGVIDRVERKRGRSGTFDRVVVRLDVFESDSGDRICTLWNTTIIPRR